MCSLLVRLFRELTTFYFYHLILNKIAPNFFLPNFLLQKKPQGNPEQYELADKPRATGIRNIRSSRVVSNEANTAQAVAFVTTQQLKDKAAKKRLAAKRQEVKFL